jgi:hypothetical protein
MYKEKRCLTKEVPESSNHLFPLLSADATHPGRVSNNNYTPRTHAVFGCTKTSLELNWIVNSKSKMERKVSNSNSVVWVYMEFDVGIRRWYQFQFLFGCNNHEIRWFGQFG